MSAKDGEQKERRILLRRISTGVEGLDKLIEGGIPKGWGVLLTGPTGTGKTILAIQFLYNGYKDYNETGVFVSLEEDTQDIFKVMQSFGWDLETLHKDKKLVIINAVPKRSSDKTEYVIKVPLFSKTFSFESIGVLLEEKIAEIDAKRVVIDGLSALTLQYQNEFIIRQGLLDLTNILHSSECTSIYTSEIPEGRPGISRFGIEEFITHGVIVLYYAREGGKRIRALEIRKMRGTKHDQSLHPYEITEKGIVVFPEEIAFIGKQVL
jgi:circadian clock protein KaiC